MMMNPTLLASLVSVVCASAIADRTLLPSHNVSDGAAIRDAGDRDDDSWERLASKFGGVKADTKASRDVVMAFTISAEVREILVKGGQKVNENDLLVKARDGDQVALLEAQRLQAANDNEIKAAALQLELEDVKYKRLLESNQYGQSEIDEARIRAATAKVQLEQAKVRNDLDKKRVEQAEGQVERYRLKAPFSGIIEEVKVEIGQGIREAEPVVRIVNTDKLWLEVYAPTMETISLGVEKGHRAWVLVQMPGKPRLVEGSVLYVSPVADYVSQNRRVRVEINNTEGWPAGTSAKVVFVDPGEGWAAYRSMAGKAVDAAGGRATSTQPAPAIVDAGVVKVQAEVPLAGETKR